MTKEQILKIIEQNKDVLTPENYQGILKNVDIFTDEERQKIANYLRMAQELMKTNSAYLKSRNILFKSVGDRYKTIEKNIQEKEKEARRDAESTEQDQSSGEAEDLISNL